MSSVQRYKVNNPAVIHEIIEGEAVLVNLDSGIYYSTDKVGAVVWDLITAGASQEQIAANLLLRYFGKEDEIRSSLAQFLSELQEEHLIVAVTDHASPSVNLPETLPGADPSPFENPELYKYTDMEELLLLDPIHEVDETGWPNLPEDEAA